MIAKRETTPWSCRLVRIFGCGTGAHVARCPDCQQYFNAVDNLDAALRRDAHAQREPAPRGLEARILRELEQNAVPASTRAWFGFPTLAFGAAATCVLAVFWFNWMQNPTQLAPTSNVAVNPAGAESISQLAPSVESLVSEGSLQTEVDSMYADARSAVRFLAANFLPAPDQTPSSVASPAPIGAG